MGSNDKWSMFKNYLHNELGITKDDIRDWLKESIKEEANKMVAKSFENFSVDSIVKSFIMDTSFYGNDKVKQEVIDAIAKEIANKISINTK